MDTKMITRRLRLGLFAIAFVLLCVGNSSAQQSWEYSPYQIRVWLKVGPSPYLNQSHFDRIAEQVVSRAESVIGAPWTVSVESPPAEVAPTEVSGSGDAPEGDATEAAPEAAPVEPAESSAARTGPVISFHQGHTGQVVQINGGAASGDLPSGPSLQVGPTPSSSSSRTAKRWKFSASSS